MQDKAGSGSGIPLAFFGITFAWAWGLWTIPLTTARGWIISPKLSGLRVLLLVGAYAPFVATFAPSFRNGTAGVLFKRAFRWKFPVPVLMIAVFLSPVLAGCAVWARSMQGGAPFAIQIGLHDAATLLFFLFFLGGSLHVTEMLNYGVCLLAEANCWKDPTPRPSSSMHRAAFASTVRANCAGACRLSSIRLQSILINWLQQASSNACKSASVQRSDSPDGWFR